MENKNLKTIEKLENAILILKCMLFMCGMSIFSISASEFLKILIG